MATRTAKQVADTQPVRFGQALANAYSEHRIGERSAAIAYHALLALMPLLLFIAVGGGFLFGAAQVEERLLSYTADTAGTEVAELVRSLLEAIRDPGVNIVASVFGAIVLLFSATNVFNHLRSAFFAVFDISLQDESLVRRTLRRRALALTYMLFTLALLALILAMHIAFSVLLSAGTTLLGAVVPSVVINVLSVLLSFFVLLALFTVVYRFAAASRLSWRYALAGAAFSAVLYVLANTLFSFVIAVSATWAIYGPAGSVIIFILWVYYLVQVVLLGAEVGRLSERHAHRP